MFPLTFVPFLVGPQTTTHLYSVTKVGPSSVSCNKRKMLGVKRTTSRWPPVWETAVHLAVAGGVFDGVFCAVLFPLDVLDEIWDLIESVSEGFLTYSYFIEGFVERIKGKWSTPNALVFKFSTYISITCSSY